MTNHVTGVTQAWKRSRTFWYLNRLKKMPVREVPYRVNQALRKQIDKYLPSSNGAQLSATDKSHSNPSQFYDVLWPKTNLPDPFPGGKGLLLKEARNVLNHDYEIFGIRANFGDPINFHLDPKTLRTWPVKFWSDIDYGNGQQVGGIKFAWELNRLHHFPKLALAYLITLDRGYLCELFTQLENWLRANPYSKGINWIMGIELGTRIVNLVYTLKFMGIDNLSFEEKKSILEFITLHANHLYRYRSKYSSCANHTIAEALGLFAAGLCFPGLKNAGKWKLLGRTVLETEISRQILPDGSSFEYSIPYLQFVMDHFLIYYLLCKEHKEPVSDAVQTRLKASFDFISSIIDVRGSLPCIGDSDDGYLLKLWFGEHNNFLSLLNSGAILFDKPEWVHPTASLDTKTQLLLGNSVGIKWQELKEQKSWRRGPTYFNNAGLSVISDSKAGKEILLIGNSGPLGLEPLSGHGHADALSFWLSVNGQPFFVDPGTYLYHSGGKWRRFFRSTAAHNTIQVDDKDQSEQLSDFMFGDFYEVRSVQWQESDHRICWGAEHDGYCRLSDPVVHRREITYLKRDHSFRMVDLLKCRGRHDVKLLFHLHPNVTVRSEGDNTYRLSTGTASIVLRADNKLEGQVFSGSEDPLMGWYSPGFNRLEKTNSLVFKKDIRGDSVLRSEVKIL